MPLNRRDFLKLGLGACLLPGLGLSLGRAATMTSEEMYVFGTLVDVGVEHGDQTLARSAIAAVARDFQWQNQAWHAWKPGGLCELNAAFAAGRSYEVEPSLLPLLAEATELARLSGGLFNPAIGGLVGLWGFHNDEMPSGALPRTERIAALAASAPSMDDLIVEGNRVSSRNPAVQLDLGGYAKGVALDRALDTLAAQGLNNAIVNLGGNLAVSGDKAGSPWHIGVRHPQGQGVLAALAVSGRTAVITSGSYERYREFGGQRYPHIIDPRTGQPAQHVASVTVIHPDAALADVAATALVVAGPEAWVDVARGMGLSQVMLVDGAGRVQMTPEMAARTSFVTRPAAIATVAV